MHTDQWSLVVAIASALVACVAAYQVKYARQQTEAAQNSLALAERVQKESSEPYVIVTIQPRDPWSLVLVVAIENIGPTVARNVRINVVPEIESSVDEDATAHLREALARRIPVLPPGHKLEYLFDTNQRWETDLPMAYQFTVHAHGPAGPVETMQYDADLHVLGAVLRGERPTQKVEDKLGKVVDHLKSISSNYATANRQAIDETNRRRLETLRQRQQEHAARANGDPTAAGS
ncbi:hypothetical protein V2W30_40740 (plasmid) [Streptomyces sp. Q6]|uniref:Uncharacterized protein n=1 Tax=Streptomyces citrinus TaxID=3118173 RepID=A0ACD5ARB7_9ACTN